MKKFMQRLLQMTAAIALIVLVGVSMTACGSDSSNDSDKYCNIDNLNGFYANIETQRLYYFDIANEKYAYGEFSISEEPDENGFYKLTISRHDDRKFVDDYSNQLRVWRGDEVLSVFKVWDKNRETLFISSRDAENKDLSKQFYVRDEKIVYSKISSLNEFFATVFPGKEIDTTDVTFTYSTETLWEDLFLAA